MCQKIRKIRIIHSNVDNYVDNLWISIKWQKYICFSLVKCSSKNNRPLHQIQPSATIQCIHKLCVPQTQLNSIRQYGALKTYHNTLLLQYVLMWCIWGKLYFLHFYKLYEVNMAMKSKFHVVKFVGLLILRTILSQKDALCTVFRCPLHCFRGNWTQKWLISDHCTICTTIPVVIYSSKQIK